MKNKRNIGIFAHVDAGKTTVSERFLQHAGAVRIAGAVDRGTAHTDRLEVERRRGISVKATCAVFSWKDTDITLIDTPGHVDFSAEVEKSMWALDGAIVIVSAAEGVQPQTEVVFEALHRQKIPCVVFVNKMDRVGADFSRVLAQLKRRLHPAMCVYSDDESIMAQIAERDENALEAYMQGEIYAREKLIEILPALMRQGEAYPVLCGSALKDEGTEELLDAAVALLPAPGGDEKAGLAGIVFALEEDPVMGRGAYVRMYSGALQNRQTVEIPVHRVTDFGEADGEVVRKITQVRAVSVEGRGADIGRIEAGDIGIVFGLGDLSVGQVLGDRTLLPREMDAGKLLTPLIMVKVEPVDPEKRRELSAALEVLSAEDPLLDVKKYRGIDHIRVMGVIQMEILKEEIMQRFHLDVEFGAPEVIYRETIAEKTVGFYAYLMPKPCWAVIKFELEPAPRGTGITYESIVPVRKLKMRYQHQIEQALPVALSQGMLGWPVDDMHITLVDGEDHQFHTHPLDFIVATPIALMDGLQRAGSVLLEPILRMVITVPETLGGKVMGEIIAMRGETLETMLAPDEGEIRITARVPVASSVDFPTRLAAISGGKGQLTTQLSGYSPCDLALGHTCPRRSVHPLDTAKYILAARSALDGGIFE